MYENMDVISFMFYALCFSKYSLVPTLLGNCSCITLLPSIHGHMRGNSYDSTVNIGMHSHAGAWERETLAVSCLFWFFRPLVR
jgi:hypothetical protein